MRKPWMGARRGAWALARFLHRKQLPGEKEKSASAASPLGQSFREAAGKRLASSRQSVLFLLACVQSPRCTKACQSPQPRPPSRPRAGFLHSLRLSNTPLGGTGFPGFPTHHLVAQAFQPVPVAGRDAPPTGFPCPLSDSGGTGFPACARRGAGRPAYNGWPRGSEALPTGDMGFRVQVCTPYFPARTV